MQTFSDKDRLARISEILGLTPGDLLTLPPPDVRLEELMIDSTPCQLQVLADHEFNPKRRDRLRQIASVLERGRERISFLIRSASSSE